MYSKEQLVQKQSQYFIYLPSAMARRVFFYPLITGYFYYEPGYSIRRTNYDNYLIMYIAKGELFLSYNGLDRVVKPGQVVLIDCRLPHIYGNGSDDILEIAWLHFDGKMGPAFYDLITEESGNVITPSNPYPVTHHLRRIYELFQSSSPIQEAAISERITAILSELIVSRPESSGESKSPTEIIENALVFINDHFREPLTLEQIAKHVSLSPYYFTRIFSAETGFTPHQYIIATRLNFAKYHLQNSILSVKEISFLSGFRSESNFCASFKKREGITPGEYRDRLKP